MFTGVTKRNIVKNIYWSITGKVVTLSGGLLVGIFVARYLGPEQYGLMNYVISYVGLFQILSSFGMDNIEIREESNNSKQKDLIIGTAFTLKVFLAISTILLISITIFLFETNAFARTLIVLYSLSMIIDSFGVIRNYFTSIVWNEYIVKTEIVRTLIGVAIKVTLLLLHAPLIWFIAALLLDGMLLASGYYISYSTHVGRISEWKYDKKWAAYLIKQSFPLLLSGAAAMIYLRIDQIMIGKMINTSSVGQFSVAAKFAEVLIFIPTIMSQTITPILVRIYKENLNEYKVRAQMFMNVTIWGCIMISIIIFLLSYWLIKYSFGNDYITAVPILQIMIFKIVGMALSATSGQLMIIENIQKYFVLRNIAGCFSCIFLNLIFIPVYGIRGVAIVTVFTAFIAGFISHAFIPRYRHIFILQVKCLLFGWISILHVRKYFG